MIETLNQKTQTQDILLYECCGYTVRMLEKQHGIDTFALLGDILLPDRKSVGPEKYHSERYKLKNEILFAMTEPNYNAVGLFKKDELVGISFSSILEQENEIWLGYFYIHPDYRRTRCPTILIHYIANILYPGRTIQAGITGSDSAWLQYFKDPKEGGAYYILNDTTKQRSKRVCEKREKVY